jgi:two-component system OmpR family sensor kinase
MTAAVLRLVRTRTPVAFVADLCAITAVALLVPAVANRLDPSTVHLAATAITVGVLAGVAVVGAAGGRAHGDGRFAWIGSALALFALVCLPLSVLGPFTLRQTNALLLTLVVAQIVVAVLLLLGGLVPGRPGRVVPWVVSGAGLLLSVVAGTVGERIPLENLPQEATIRGAVVVGWSIAALTALRNGLRRRDSAVWRVGLGLAVMAAAQLHEAVVRASFAEPTVVAAALWLVGATGALAAALRSLRRSVTGLISEREQQRAALHDAVAQVERVAALTRERDHELANGLAGLAGIAYLLDQPVEQATRDGGALRSAVLAEITRLHAMLARPASLPDAAPRTFTSLDVAAVLTEVVALHRASGHDIELVVDMPLRAQADRDAVVQVVTNLLVNCARHAPGSHVEVRARQDRDRVIVEVRDDGPGAPPGSEDALVEEGVTGAGTGGSGLGLAVSRRLILEQDGDLRVLPVDGAGFLVRFTLPAARLPARRTRPSGGSERIAS